MAQVGSLSATAAKVSLAFSNQNEWSIATALLNCGRTDGSQETGKFTLPSLPGSPAGCSCWATADIVPVNHAQAITRHETRGNLIPTCLFGSRKMYLWLLNHANKQMLPRPRRARCPDIYFFEFFGGNSRTNDQETSAVWPLS